MFARITARRQHHGYRTAWVPFNRASLDRSTNRRLQQWQQVRFHSRQNRLRLGVTETTVKLQHARLPAGNDQPRIKKSLKRDAFMSQAAQQRPHDFAVEQRLQLAVPIIRRTEGAHAARVRPLIAIPCALMVASGLEQKITFSVYQ